MLKNLLNAGKCMLGFHQGEWQYESPGSCLKFQVCENCQKRSTKTEHSWKEWEYAKDGECQQVRVCPRCQQQETRTMHIWSADAYYKNDGDCTAVQYCERCAEEKLYGKVHKWEQWVYMSADTCNQSQKCSRCGILGDENRVEHIWNDWQFSAFYNARLRICQHCGSMSLHFDSSPVPLPTMQDVDGLFHDFVRVKTVPEISRWLRVNPFVFDQPTNPILTAYLHFIDVHMLEGETKERYKALGEACKVWGAIGSEALLSELDAIAPQVGQSPWSLVNSATIAAASKKFRPKSDQRLLGHWIFTETMGSGGFGSVTDYHQIFEENGGFRKYSHAVSSLGTNNRTSPVYGQWSTQNNVITIQFSDGTSNEFPYHLEGNTLYYPNRGSIWKRA